MGIPLLIGGAVVALGLIKKYFDDKTLDEQTRKPGHAYRLPPCCIAALKTTRSRGTLAACIGAGVSTVFLVGQSQPEKPSLKSPQQMGKALHDGWELVTMDWEANATLLADFARGIQAIGNNAMLDVVYEHYALHVRDNDSDARRFWTRLYEKLRRRTDTNYRRALDVIEQDDAQFRPR